MPLTTNFFSTALQREINGRGLDVDMIAKALGYRSAHFLRSWLDGRSLPQLTALVDLAHEIGTPAEDLLFCWLADLDPKHVADFWIIADLLHGEDRANELLGDASAGL